MRISRGMKLRALTAPCEGAPAGLDRGSRAGAASGRYADRAFSWRGPGAACPVRFQPIGYYQSQKHLVSEQARDVDARLC